MNSSIRHLQGDEMFNALFTLNQYSLQPSPPFQNKEEWLSIVRNRKGVTCHALFEDDLAVSIAVSTSMTQNIRGKLFPAAGIWGVSTHPSGRRKGCCRDTIASLLAAERAAGKVFSNLYPFRESFYEKLGYVTYPLMKKVEFSPQSLTPFLKMDLPGEVKLQLIGEGFETYRSYLTQMRKTCHGMAFFDFGDQVAANRNSLWTALAVIKGQIEGLMLYRLNGEEPTKFEFRVPRFYYQTHAARALLLNWIARHIDQADRTELYLQPDEFPETWVADIQVKIEAPTRAAMNRVLDVSAIGGMQAGTGTFSARISDPNCPWNSDSWQFTSQEGFLQVSKAERPQCDLTIQGLTALIAGVHDPAEFQLRGWGNPDPNLQAVLREMFPKKVPYLHENF